ncbi:Reverse transcriptase, partial [Giardia duodenalis]
VTNIFHRVLLKRLIRHANYLSCEQIAFKQNAYAVGVRRAHELISRPGMHAVSLDIKNALNSLPRAEVVRALNEAGVPKVLIDYIRNFLDLRHSKDVKCEVCGVPQGDPLSMFLFCMAIERLLRRLKERGITFLAYADDIVAFHDEAYPAGAIVQQATVEAAAMGLAIRSDKCKSTMAGEEVTFPNHPASPTPASLAPKAIAGAETALRKIENAPITIHQKLILVSLCVVPMVNYAPLVEIISDKADYEKFDRRPTRLQQNN